MVFPCESFSDCRLCLSSTFCIFLIFKNGNTACVHQTYPLSGIRATVLDWNSEEFCTPLAPPSPPLAPTNYLGTTGKVLISFYNLKLKLMTCIHLFPASIIIILTFLATLVGGWKLYLWIQEVWPPFLRFCRQVVQEIMREPRPLQDQQRPPPPPPPQQQQQQQPADEGRRQSGVVHVVFHGNVQIVNVYHEGVPARPLPVIEEDFGGHPPGVRGESPIAPRFGTPRRQNELLPENLLRRVLASGDGRRSVTPGPPDTPRREETPPREIGTPQRPSPFLGSDHGSPFTPHRDSPEMGLEATPRLRFTPQGTPYQDLEVTPTPQVPSTRTRNPCLD